jgi:Na+-translocating ferredoxin:NAD+ oxidoreductase RnfE subunit
VTAAIEIAGWSGAGILLAAYALVSLRRLDGDGTLFQIMNILGAAGIALHSGTNRAWASASLNLVWIAIGFVALARRTSRARQPGPA